MGVTRVRGAGSESSRRRRRQAAAAPAAGPTAPIGAPIERLQDQRRQGDPRHELGGGLRAERRRWSRVRSGGAACRPRRPAIVLQHSLTSPSAAENARVRRRRTPRPSAAPQGPSCTTASIAHERKQPQFAVQPDRGCGCACMLRRPPQHADFAKKTRKRRLPLSPARLRVAHPSQHRLGSPRCASATAVVSADAGPPCRRPPAPTLASTRPTASTRCGASTSP